MKKLITTVAMLVTFASAQVIAGGYDDLKDKYWGVSTGISEIDIYDYDDDNMLSIYGGARIGKSMGIEIGYTDFGTFNRGRNRIEADGFYFAARMVFNKSDKMEIYGKAGFMRWDYSRNNDYSVDGFDPMFGIGASFNFKKNMDIVAEYTKFEVNDYDVDVYSVGLKFNLK